MKYTHQVLNTMRQPASESEEQRISNAITMIKDALKKHAVLSTMDIEIFVQGSYANDTNIKVDSDIDVSVMLRDTFYTKYRPGASREDYGILPGTDKYSDYKSNVLEAITSKFGKDNVSLGNKSISINSNSYHVQADVVPSFQFRNYYYDKNNDVKNFYEGIKFFASDGTEVINYPKQHIKNGKAKNANTTRRYKRTVRLFKKIRNKMKDEGWAVPDSISSFLLECLVYQIPDKYFVSDNLDWNDVLKPSIGYLYNQIDKGHADKWTEVSGRIYLFHEGRKWAKEDAKSFLKDLWNFLEYNQQ